MGIRTKVQINTTMRYIFIIVLATMLMSCSFKMDNCNANPTVAQNKNPKPSEDKQETSLLEEIERHVQPGAEVACTY